MATSSSSCKNPLEINDDLEAKEDDTELQNIFERLRVNRRNRRKEESQTKKIKKEKLRTKISGRLPEKHKRMKILKDPTFIFTSTLNKVKNETSKDLSVKDLEKSFPENEPQKISSPSSGPRHRLQGCGEQFRNGTNVRVSDSINMDDTTPEELAAYFDQLLHIPKPMSQMAEMMYT